MATKKKLLQAAAGVSTGPEGAWDLSYAYYDPPSAWDISTTTYIRLFSVSGQETNPEGIFFKPDGTKMYVVGLIGQDVNEYNLSTGWDISTATYSQNFSVSSQEIYPTDVFFKSDGSKMYVIGEAGDDVNEYSLSTAWDVSTASYLQNFSLSAQETSPQGIFFKPDGTKMYIAGEAGVDVNEYNLSTAWDVSTASYNQNFSVSAQESTPTSVSFKTDGTKMYILGRSGDDINEYDLSTAWDISTASYNQNFSVSGQDTSPKGLFFKPDGTAVYMIGITNDRVYQYALGGFYVGAQETIPNGVTFKPDGDKMYVIGSGGDAVDEYSANSAKLSVANKDTAPTGVTFKSDGTEMYVVGSSSDSVHQYSLSTAWDITSASFLQTFSVSAQELVPFEVVFKTDGTKMYITGFIGQDINEYNLSTAWDISTASYNQNFVPSGQLTEPASVFFKSDGTKMYILASGAGELDVNEYNLSTAWDISTSSFSQAFDISSQDTAPQGLSFKSDGTKMYMLGGTGDDVNEYSLSTAWDISTASYSHSFSIASQDASPSGITFKSDGTKMYMVGRFTSDAVHEYDLSTAWDVSTAEVRVPEANLFNPSQFSYTRTFSVSAQETNPQSVSFKPDGTKMYVIGLTGDDINEYDLSTAWNVSTASFLQLFSVSSQETSPASVRFKGDGTKMFVIGYSGDAVFEYNLSTAWDVSSASYSQSFSTASQEAAASDLFFKSDGTKMYVLGTSGLDVNEYNLSTAWDVSTASYTQNFSVSDQSAYPYGFYFHPEGTQMFVIDAYGSQRIFTYSLGVQE